MTETTDDAPKAFISYSWSSPEHEDFVLQLATELNDLGVHVVFDKWDLREGHDANYFMESMVRDKDVKKVIMVCDRVYCEKANQRSGGAGTEAQIISPQIYTSVSQQKFVALVLEWTPEGKPVVPDFYHGHIHIDYSNDANRPRSLENLVRWIFDRPLYERPPIGKPPAHIFDQKQITLGTTASARLLSEALRSGRTTWQSLAGEYFSTFTDNFDRFCMNKPADGEHADDLLIQNLNVFTPSRNEALGVIADLAKYQSGDDLTRVIHSFLERLIQFLDGKTNLPGYFETDFDNFKFLVHELLLYTIGILLKHERFIETGAILDTEFYSPASNRGETGMVPYSRFRQRIKTLEIRKQRLGLARLSLQADIFKERSAGSCLAFKLLMQSDFVLYLKSVLHPRKNGSWWPDTLVYAEYSPTAFEIFAKSQSKKYFVKIATMLNIDGIAAFEQLFKEVHEQRVLAPHWDHIGLDLRTMVAFERLCTRP